MHRGAVFGFPKYRVRRGHALRKVWHAPRPSSKPNCGWKMRYRANMTHCSRFLWRAPTCESPQPKCEGWYSFRRMLEYKTEWRGALLRVLPPEGTSTTCPECGREDTANRPGLRKWFQCVACGHREHSGTVAGRNLLQRAGHARLACSPA